MITRRESILSTLFGTGLVGLRALASGLPAAFLLNPRRALAAGLLRGEGSLARVKVPADAVAVELRLELPAVDYPRYRAALLDANGDEVWIASKLRAEGEAGQPAVVLLLPSGLLPPGDYQVKLSGSSDGREPETLGTYAFRASPP
jgi:hypothetical protein